MHLMAPLVAVPIFPRPSFDPFGGGVFFRVQAFVKSDPTAHTRAFRGRMVFLPAAPDPTQNP